jgi:NDP-sugar pyrophosphorylase family protein
VDILSNVRIDEILQAGEEHDATLLVSNRQTSRYLLFDEDMRLVGWTNIDTGEVRSPYPQLDPSRYRRLAFAGIHVMNPTLFSYFDEFPERFSIIDFYLKVCDRASIYGYEQADLRLLDVGKQDALEEAESFVKSLSEGEGA